MSGHSLTNRLNYVESSFFQSSNRASIKEAALVGGDSPLERERVVEKETIRELGKNDLVSKRMSLKFSLIY